MVSAIERFHGIITNSYNLRMANRIFLKISGHFLKKWTRVTSKQEKIPALRQHAGIDSKGLRRAQFYNDNEVIEKKKLVIRKLDL